ncbi:MAG: DUF6678 family protein [Butyrivibrio sp.]|nr:DUF6678 family protein [Butyrivibrio sp.]
MPKKIYDKLQELLEPRSGVVQPYVESDEKLSSVKYKIRWEGNIAFVVEGWENFGWYYVERNGERVSALFHYKKIDDKVPGIMQNMIDEIEGGKYNGKKTLSDKILDVVEKRQLTSYMNKTKWNELFHDIDEIPDLLINYKTLFEEKAPGFFWTIRGDEHFFHMNTAEIEWFAIKDTIKKSEIVGRLLPPKENEYSVREQIESILHEHSISYEYNESEKMFVVYGYSR